METNNSSVPKKNVPWHKEVDLLIAGLCAGVFGAFLIWSQLAGDNMGEISETSAGVFYAKAWINLFDCILCDTYLLPISGL